VRVYRRGAEPSEDLSATTSPEQRLAMIELLSREAFELAGQPLPAYRRADAPVLAALLGAEARFLVVGAHALAVHGVPRATGDLDVWIAADPTNAERVWAALLRFGAPVAAMGVSLDDLTLPDRVVQIGLPPRRIDILTAISGVGFDEAWPDRVTHEVGGLAVPFLGRAALVRNKRATGRTKDRADLEALGEAG
jgi:hypothetical protein